MGLDRALEDRAEHDQHLVGGPARQVALVDELVAPLVDLVGVDLLHSLAPEGGQEVGVQDRVVVRQARGLPGALADAPGDPFVGGDVEGHAGPPLLGCSAPGVGEDRLQRGVGVLLP